ncbi:hypothetical protein [Nocardioides daeguensis]|uniref:WXG100 family type VII secretion target n=1 Tax=Nocardioides daeguensis TaxID=908359 RepID=A0ABP6V642_9ACTN|nr:hypothetical protein [Nocardioides daeguensis]MBV6726339.1 hypothetical protein [Nocardioides daeguensis]MCR1772182.1 hypothetical protein [Nocardioides daeguensis]
MSSYDDLDSLIVALKIARISAWMKSEGWIGHASYGWFRLRVAGTTGYQEEVTGTDSNGEGGGKYSLSNVDQDHIHDYIDAFNEIRSAVDEHLSPWRTLPDPAVIQKWIEPMRLATSEIAISAIDQDGGPTGGGEIVGAIELAMTAAKEWAGHTAAAFKLNFLSQLSTAVGGQYALCLCLGGHLEAQKGIWTEARQAVADIVVNTTKAYDAVTYDSGLSWSLAFKVLGYAAAGAAIFATGGAVIPVAVAGLGITVASDAYEAVTTETEKPSVSYESVRDAMPGYFTQLNEDIVKEERAIQTNLNHNLNVVLNNKSSFDLSRPALLDVDDDSDLSNDNIFYRDQEVRDMCSTYLPAVARHLFKASRNVSDSYVGSIFSDFDRGPGIGIDSNGPMEEWDNIWLITRDLLEDLGEETKASATTLDLAMSDIGQADTSGKDALEKHAAASKDIGTGDSFGLFWSEHRDPEA